MSEFTLAHARLLKQQLQTIRDHPEFKTQRGPLSWNGVADRIDKSGGAYKDPMTGVQKTFQGQVYRYWFALSDEETRVHGLSPQVQNLKLFVHEHQGLLSERAFRQFQRDRQQSQDQEHGTGTGGGSEQDQEQGSR